MSPSAEPRHEAPGGPPRLQPLADSSCTCRPPPPDRVPHLPAFLRGHSVSPLLPTPPGPIGKPSTVPSSQSEPGLAVEKTGEEDAKALRAGAGTPCPGAGMSFVGTGDAMSGGKAATCGDGDATCRGGNATCRGRGCHVRGRGRHDRGRGTPRSGGGGGAGTPRAGAGDATCGWQGGQSCLREPRGRFGT